jgi:hypothetical protein
MFVKMKDFTIELSLLNLLSMRTAKLISSVKTDLPSFMIQFQNHRSTHFVIENCNA